jgi:hypothetical protein
VSTVPRKKQPANACYGPGGVEYSADRNTAVALIPRQQGEGYDAIKLRKVPEGDSKRCWLVQLNSHPWFSIAHQQLLSPSRSAVVAVYQLSRRDKHLDRFLPDIVRVTEVEGWTDIIKRLIATLLTQGGSR